MIRSTLPFLSLVGLAIVFAPGKPAEEWDIRSPNMICRHAHSRFHDITVENPNMGSREGETQAISPITYFLNHNGIHAHEGAPPPWTSEDERRR